jgi:hypothetical protein
MEPVEMSKYTVELTDWYVTCPAGSMAPQPQVPTSTTFYVSTKESALRSRVHYY